RPPSAERIRIRCALRRLRARVRRPGRPVRGHWRRRRVRRTNLHRGAAPAALPDHRDPAWRAGRAVVRRLRSVVFGYHDIGVACLEELLASGDEVALVVTHADRPREEIWWRSVGALAERHHVPVLVDPDVSAQDLAARLRALAPDFVFSFMCRTVLPRPL